jgi:hypothetical protein
MNPQTIALTKKNAAALTSHAKTCRHDAEPDSEAIHQHYISVGFKVLEEGG